MTTRPDFDTRSTEGHDDAFKPPGLPQVMMHVEPADDGEIRKYDAAVWFRGKDQKVVELAAFTFATEAEAVTWMHRREIGDVLRSGITGTITTLRRHDVTWQGPHGTATETFWQPIHFDGYLYDDTMGLLALATSEVVS